MTDDTQAGAILSILISKEWGERSEKLDDAILKAVQPTIKKHTDAVYDALESAVRNWLTFNLADNITQYVERQVEHTIRVLLGADERACWEASKVVLDKHGRGASELRAAIAKLIPQEVAAARIVDLEEAVKRLEDELKWRRDR